MRHAGALALVLALMAGAAQAGPTPEQAAQLPQLDALLGATMKQVGAQGPKVKQPQLYWVHRNSSLKGKYLQQAQAGAVVWSSAPGLGLTLQGAPPGALQPLSGHAIVQGVGAIPLVAGSGNPSTKGGGPAGAMLFGSLPGNATGVLGVPGQGCACAVVRYGNGWVVFVPEPGDLQPGAADADLFWFNLKRWSLEQAGLWAGNGPTPAGQALLAGGEAGKETAGKNQPGQGGKDSVLGGGGDKNAQSLGAGPKQITLAVQDQDLASIVKQIGQQAGVKVSTYLRHKHRASLNVQGLTLEQALDKLCEGGNLRWFKAPQNKYYVTDVMPLSGGKG